jgi:hypothetical protein
MNRADSPSSFWRRYPSERSLISCRQSLGIVSGDCVIGRYRTGQQDDHRFRAERHQQVLLPANPLNSRLMTQLRFRLNGAASGSVSDKKSRRVRTPSGIRSRRLTRQRASRPIPGCPSSSLPTTPNHVVSRAHHQVVSAYLRDRFCHLYLK